MVIQPAALSAIQSALSELLGVSAAEAEAAVAQLVGDGSEWGDLRFIDAMALGEVAPRSKVARRAVAVALLHSIDAETPICGDHFPWERRDGAVRIVSEGACPRCGEWVEASKPATRWDWVRAAEVPVSTTVNIDQGDAVPVPLVIGGKVEGYDVDPAITKMLKTVGVSLDAWLNYTARMLFDGDAVSALIALRTVPQRLAVGHALRAEVIRAQEDGVRPIVRAGHAAPQRPGLPSAHDICDLFIRCGLSSPERRRLLLAWLPDGLVAGLPRLGSPRDQMMSDIMNLSRSGWSTAKHPMVTYLTNGARLISYRTADAAQLKAWAAAWEVK